MIGSSVVPGLPNIFTTPSSLSTRRKASRPVMVLGFLSTLASGIVSSQAFLTLAYRHVDGRPPRAPLPPADMAGPGRAGTVAGRAHQHLLRGDGYERQIRRALRRRHPRAPRLSRPRTRGLACGARSGPVA